MWCGARFLRGARRCSSACPGYVTPPAGALPFAAPQVQHAARPPAGGTCAGHGGSQGCFVWASCGSRGAGFPLLKLKHFSFRDVLGPEGS